ncbi:anti-sigma factor antagonist [Spirochaetia bacterium]|nr:anti-sigma factor antagonist [Spirochaetia bacterium]GHU33207.1 anti-sigma factor antagonist [Spirochaetia bacterium]
MTTNDALVPEFDDNYDENLHIELRVIREVEHGLYISLSGYIDTDNSELLQKRLTKIVKAGYVRLIVQCAQLQSVSSTGVSAFAQLLKSIKTRKGQLVFVNVQQKVRQVFQLLGFSTTFQFEDSFDRAIHVINAGTDRQEPALFPVIIICPRCVQKVRIHKPGDFRCSWCKAALTLEPTGRVRLC